MLFPFMGDGENTPLWLAAVELAIACVIFAIVIILMKACYT
jgi:hypothetical protein